MSSEDLVALLALLERGFNADRLDEVDPVLNPDVIVPAPFPVEAGAG